MYDKLASAIYNDIYSGLRGLHHNMSLTMEQLVDDIIDERMQILKEYTLKGIIPFQDLIMSINCIQVDCKDLEKCGVCGNSGKAGKPVAHFEMPQLMFDYGLNPIIYIGSADKQNPFIYYTTPKGFSQYRKYRKRGKDKPYVYIDVAPNENGMLDCYIFNAPLMKQISVTAIFKDPRQLEQYSCCSSSDYDSMSFLNAEIKKRVTEKKIRYYRQFQAPIQPNNQQYN